MEADHLAAEGDPLRDITALRRVTFVMESGRVHENVPELPTRQLDSPGPDVLRSGL